MLNYIYQTLIYFRKVFSHRSTWLIFCMVTLGFIGSREMQGVTSLCRFWTLGPSGYNMFLHFFRVSTWSLDALIGCWCAFVLSQNQTVQSDGRVVLFGDHLWQRKCGLQTTPRVHQTVQSDGRVVLFGDHTCVAKDGRRMPCVVTMHQHSETQSKPSYFRGHFWGAVGMLIGSIKNPFCIPLALGIHQGLAHVGEDDKQKRSNETLGKRIVQMAIDFALRHDQPSILTLDAFFPWWRNIQTGSTFLVCQIQVPTGNIDRKSQEELRCLF